ncbi:MAG TPA: hypothetical protein PLL20_06110 [Phycisphaerae bacterium]|mgnify:CR=1 FL=1|nr:hypothetical protein [Phycisphaerae bacterium]HRR86889.1 hypothetical protein [Phycisphaerae bacterium]
MKRYSRPLLRAGVKQKRRKNHRVEPASCRSATGWKPGPHDATYLFDCFIDMIRSGKAPTAEEMAAAQARLEGKAG